MSEFAQLGPAALKVVYPSAAIIGTVLVTRMKKLDPRTSLGLVQPSVGPTVAWVMAYVALILLSDGVMHWRGPWDFSWWKDAPLLVSACRVLGVALLGPIAEELIFRGALYDRLMRLKLDPRLTIVILAAVWAVLHYSYAGGVIALIGIGGLLLGAARRQTGSVVPPVLMHITWNLYAIW